MYNVQLNNLETQGNTREIDLNETEKIMGSGPLSWAGAGTGALLGGAKGAISYPVSEGWEKLMTGESDYTLADHGGSIVGNAAGGAAIGSGIGKAIESLGNGPKI